MKNPKQVKQIPMTNEEIEIVIRTLSLTIPPIEDQKVVVDIVSRLDILLRL